MKQELNQPAQNLLDKFLNLNITGTEIPCPYFNNRRQKVRGGLRVNIGKGSPTELKQEVKIQAKKQNLDLNKINENELKKFMIDNKLGIDCSAFVYYILNKHTQTETNQSLKSKLDFSHKNLLRRVISNFRPIINTNVELLSHSNNSQKIKLKQAEAGDLIVIKEYGPRNDKDHIAIITAVDFDDKIQQLECAHSFQWDSEGRYGGGVRKFEIDIKNKNDNLINQTWTELDQTNEDNETYKAAQSAKKLQIKRISL